MDLQQNIWLSEVRMTPAGSLDGCDKSSLSPQMDSKARANPPVPPSSLEASSRKLAALYRFAWPRASFFTLGFFDPRA